VESDPTAASISAPSAPEPAPPPPKRTSVPQSYLKPWELVRSREEAVYEMALEVASTGPLRRLFARLRHCFGGRDARRWRALLEGKTPDQQLWAVRPPCARPLDPEVRSWAERTLDEAGYDARTMLREWEIYWRRKRI
jgi:hypothetical protein